MDRGNFGSPRASRWSSGFPRTSEVSDTDSLNAQELFRWLSDVAQLSEGDIDALRCCSDLPHARMAEQIYRHFLEFKAIRERLGIGSEEQLAQRTNMVEKYLAWCMNLKRDSTDSYVRYLDHVAAVHQRGPDPVPSLHLLAGLATAQDIILQHVCEHIEDRDQLRQSACAVSKLMWIQAAFFIRHATRGRQAGHGPRSFLRRFSVLWATLTARRLAAALVARALPRSFRASTAAASLRAGLAWRLVDVAVAAAGSVLWSALQRDAWMR